jgi:hypothetical protein
MQLTAAPRDHLTCKTAYQGALAERVSKHTRHASVAASRDPFAQAVMALRSFKMPSAYRSWVSIATAYRYLPEVVDVIADQATDLPKPTRGTSLVSSGNGTVLFRARESGPPEPSPAAVSAGR